MRAMRMPLPEPPTGRQVASYPTYARAQRAVDFLSDNKFPVQYVTIVGHDLQLVERVTGRLTRSRAVLAGLAGGAWWGLFVGFLLGLFAGARDSFTVLVLVGILLGAVFGLLFGLAGYAATGGQRDFTSRTAVVAGTYDLLCEPKYAQDAIGLLAKLALRSGEL